LLMTRSEGSAMLPRRARRSATDWSIFACMAAFRALHDRRPCASFFTVPWPPVCWCIVASGRTHGATSARVRVVSARDQRRRPRQPQAARAASCRATLQVNTRARYCRLRGCPTPGVAAARRSAVRVGACVSAQ
jgi:hypothetical protein